MGIIRRTGLAFLLYAAMAAGFGGCYYGMHQKDRRAFSFSGDAQKAQEGGSFSDFLYFSATTQFPVGHGDIQPNSSDVRLVVVGQTAVAVFFFLEVIRAAINAAARS